MEEPKYHLQGVVKSREQMEDFDGPLDVILLLLSKNKIEIRDIQDRKSTRLNSSHSSVSRMPSSA